MSTRFILCVLSLACFAFAGCNSNDVATKSTDWQSFEGEVVWVKTKRGFWGIQTTELGKINPLKLPEAFKENGLNIRGEVRLFPDSHSARNYGTIGELRGIERVSE